MSQRHDLVPRVVVATVAVGKASVKDDVSQIVVDELDSARFHFVRAVTVNREKQFIQQLVSNIANSNGADAVILLGGAGIGPRDFTCEALAEIAERNIEGFGEAYRALLRDELGAGASALLSRATAGVCNRCIVFALPRQPDAVRRAMRSLIVPTLSSGVRIATGAARAMVP
ncbi:MAG: molybdopterin-binding protein [Polyangiaceae bacterium]|nr:molybdopterin-binding protein [Polyangiaceae bacterium]